MRKFTAQLCWLGIIASIAIPCLADTVTLDNGDRLSGAIARRENGKLVINTSYAGKVKIDMRRIRTLQSDNTMTIVLDNDQRLYGKISGSGAEITVQPADQGTPRRQSMGTVIDILPGIVTGQEWKKSGHVNIGWSDSAGNTAVTRLHTDAEIVARRGKNRYTAGAVVNYAKDQNVESESNARAYAKYDRFFTPKWYTYTNTTFEHDKFRDIRLRSTLGFGSGWQAIASSHTNLALEGGLEYVYTDFYVALNDQFPAARLALRFDHYLIPDKVQFFHKSEGYVSLGTAKKSFARAATGLRMPLRENFVATTEYDVSWDGEPTPSHASTDRFCCLRWDINGESGKARPNLRVYSYAS